MLGLRDTEQGDAAGLDRAWVWAYVAGSGCGAGRADSRSAFGAAVDSGLACGLRGCLCRCPRGVGETH
jgi:hypothetical protein